MFMVTAPAGNHGVNDRFTPNGSSFLFAALSMSYKLHALSNRGVWFFTIKQQRPSILFIIFSGTGLIIYSLLKDKS